MPRFIARVVSISESQRSNHRTVQFEPWSPENSDRLDPEGSPFVHRRGLILPSTHIDLLASDADQMRPGQFIGFNVTPVTDEEAVAIAADAKERMARLKAQCCPESGMGLGLHA